MIVSLLFVSSHHCASNRRPVKTNIGSDKPNRRFCHVGVVHNESMFVFGGYDGSDRLNDFVRFDFTIHDMTFEVPPSTLVAEFRALVDEETLSDVTFLVEGTPVFAHKLMLMRCSYFRALFLGEMKESKMATIRIEQVSHAIFLQVLEYLYTDQLQIPFESAMVRVKSCRFQLYVVFLRNPSPFPHEYVVRYRSSLRQPIFSVYRDSKLCAKNECYNR
jgi:hypothetical protein